MTYAKATVSTHDDLYWISAKDVDEKNPTWGVRLHSSDFITEGGLIVGATGLSNGTFSGGSSALLNNGSLGLHTTDPQAELHVNGFVNRIGEQTPSDKRLKSNIQSFDKGLEEVLKLNPISYSYIKEFINSDRQHIGLAAQEVQKVLPELVGSMELGTDKKSKEAYLNIYDNEIKFLLINAIKEQQEQIEELNRKIEQFLFPISEIDQKEISLAYEGKQSALLQSRPNPNNGQTVIDFIVPDKFENARLLFFGMNGELIKEEQVTESGYQSLKVNTKGLTAGRYNYTLEVDGKLIETKAMIVID